MPPASKNFIIFYLPVLLVLLIAFIRCYLYFVYAPIDVCNSRLNRSMEEQQTPKLLQQLYSVRDSLADKIYFYLPSPHAELVLGMVLGLDRFNDVPGFKQALKDTGTIHVVVVSGFNISLVFALVIKMVGSPYKSLNVIFALLITFLYAILTGFEAPVVRAWVMGSICAISRLNGRVLDAFRVLCLTSLFMILIRPCYSFEMSFQLSVLATIGLVIFGNSINEFLEKKLKIKNYMLEDFSSSLAAQILVIPLLSHEFGSISAISLLVNSLILWTVPIGTITGGVLILTMIFSDTLSYFVSLYVYYLLDIFVRIVRYFSLFNYSVLDYETSTYHTVAYYVVIICVIINKLYIQFTNDKK